MAMKAAPLAVVNLIVVDMDPEHDWTKVFGNQDGRLKVFQTSWDKISLQKSDWKGCIINIAHSDTDNCIPFRGMDRPRENIEVHFMLVRNYPRLLHEIDFTNLLLGLHFGGVQSVNTIWSLLQATNRAILYAALNAIKRRLGPEKFPFIDAKFYENLKHEALKMTDTYPCVVKVASSCAGYGKAKINKKGALDDLRGILGLHNDFFTVEPFLKSEYDIRLQWLGGHTRAWTRKATTDAWKLNTAEANSVCEEIPVTPAYMLMLKETAALFGGLDICTVDLLHLVGSGEEPILEINDSGSGIWESRYGFGQPSDKGRGEDNVRIRDIVLKRIDTLYPKPAPAVAASKAPRKKMHGGLLAALGKK